MHPSDMRADLSWVSLRSCKEGGRAMGISLRTSRLARADRGDYYLSGGTLNTHINNQIPGGKTSGISYRLFHGRDIAVGAGARVCCVH